MLHMRFKIVQNASPFHHVSSQTPSIRCRALSLDTVKVIVLEITASFKFKGGYAPPVLN